MFDKLEDLLHHYEELMNTLSEPDVANDPNRFRKLMKEQSDLQPIVDAYKEYKACKQTIEDSLAILDEESDEEMRELAKEELNEAKSRSTTRTLLWRFVQVPVERKLRFLRLKFTVCMYTTQSVVAGKWRHLRRMKLESEA